MFVVLSICSLAGISQPGTGIEPHEVYLRITETYTRNDSFFVKIKGGTGTGVVKGLLGKCFWSYIDYSDGTSRSVTEIGSGEITYAGKDTSECYVSLYQARNTLKAGDLAALQVKLPAIDYKSIFYELSLDNVEFTDQEDDFIYTLSSLLTKDSKTNEEVLKAAILADFRNTYEKYKDNPNLSKRVRVKMTEGRFKGKIAFDMLKDATLSDLNSFLLYLKTYPDGYRGKNYRISQSFMGWIVSNAPYSYPEVKAALYPVYKNTGELQKRLPAYKTDIIKEKACQAFAAEATAFSDRRQYDSAYKMIDFARTIAYAVNDTFGKAAVHLLKAQIDQDREKYAEAIKECDNAIKFAAQFTNSKDKERYKEFREKELRAMIKKGFCQYEISLYKEAEHTLNDEKDRQEKYAAYIGYAIYSELLGKRYEYAAMISYYAGNYDMAFKNIDMAIAINDSLNSTDSKARNAYNYWLKGKVFNKQLNTAEALQAFHKSIAIYKARSDEQNMADVLKEIGASYYDLSDYRKSIEYLDSAGKTLVKFGNNNSAGYSKSLIGNCYWQLGNYDSAIISHKEAIILRQNSSSGLAYSWKQLGSLYKFSGLKNEALTAYYSALDYSRNSGDSISVAEIYNDLGIVFHNDEYYSKAVEFYLKSFKIRADRQPGVFYNLGNAYYNLDTVKAKQCFEEAVLQSRMRGDKEYLFSSMVSLSELAYRNYNFPLGNQYYREAAALSKEINQPQTEAERLGLRGYSYLGKLELDSSLYYYDQSLHILDTVSKDGYIWGLIKMASVYISKGEFKTADSLYRTAAHLAMLTRNKRALGISLTSSSFLYAQLGEFDKGIDANDSAASIFRRTGNYYQLANTYVDRGALYKSMGDYKQSILFYLLADSIYLDQKTEENRGNVFNNIGVTYYNQGDYEKAIANFNKSAKYINQAQVTETYLLNKANIAECYYYLKKHEQAKKIMLQIFPQSGKIKRIATGMAIVLGQIYFDAKQFDSAAYYLGFARDYSFASGEKESMIKTLVWLGKTEAAKEHIEEAGRLLKQAVDITHQYKMVSQGWESLYELGLFYYSQKKMDSAIINFKEAVEIVEKNAGNLYGGEEAGKLYKNDPRKYDLYSKLIAVLADGGKDEEAWAYANRSNITGMKELAGHIPSGSGNPEKNATIKQGAQLIQQQNTIDRNIKDIISKPEAEQNKEQLQGYYAEREIIEAKYLKFVADLKLKDTTLAGYFSNNVDPVKFKKYRGELQPDMAVILYVINDNKLMAFTLTNEKLSIKITDLQTDIGQTIKRFNWMLKNRSGVSGTAPLVLRSELDKDDEKDIGARGSFKDYSDTLYNYLIRGIRSQIETKKKICIIPNGDLSRIPFQCLGTKMPDSSFRFLVEDFTIFYTNQMDIFLDKPSPKEDIASFAAFGVPDKTLRYTQKEAQAIGDILEMKNAVYTGNIATEKMAKMSLSGKKYVHFATHGILDYVEYSRSYLKFVLDKDTSGGNDGKLTMDEIEELQIDGCDLVTLSACETAVGKQLRPGWQISPANSFILNRVKSVLATLWKVDDEATSILMDEFYSQLKNGTGKADALRLAQQKLSQNPKYVHPFYWAPFVLYGDWR